MPFKNSSVIFKITNYSEYSVIKDLTQNQINLKVFHSKNNAYYEVNLKDFNKIKKYFFYYDIKTIRYKGNKYWLDFIKMYYLSIIGLLLSIIFISMLSNLIVDIDIQTSDQRLYQVVKQGLEEEGIKPFTVKKNYDNLNIIKGNIKNKYESDIDWLEIKNVGMKYIVNVEKRVNNQIKESPKYCNIYAKKNGLIKRVKTYQGVSLVAMNDYVQKDDLLISGDINVNEKTVNQVCANGVVYAEVWYIINIKIPLYYNDYQITNKIRNNIVIKHDNYEFVLFKNRLENYKSKDELIWEILGIRIYKRKDVEIVKKIKKYSEEEAVKKANELALNKIKMKIENDEKIIKQKVLQKQLIDSTMNIDIFIITEEKIGYSNIEG